MKLVCIQGHNHQTESAHGVGDSDRAQAKWGRVGADSRDESSRRGARLHRRMGAHLVLRPGEEFARQRPEKQAGEGTASPTFREGD